MLLANYFVPIVRWSRSNT